MNIINTTEPQIRQEPTSVIKSVQYGRTTVRDSVAKTVSHTSVNIDKSFVILSSASSSGVSAYLTTRTTSSLTLSSNSSTLIDVSWQLIEFY